jgi:hypothetical protein
MKYFTEPNGKFVFELPIEWQYKNVLIGYEECSPFSFELYNNPIGAFQISCYPIKNINSNQNNIKQEADKDNLEFTTQRMDDDDFNCHLWFCAVDDHAFIAKYIYQKKRENIPRIKKELKKVEKTLSTLMFISTKNRKLALELDRFEKFHFSLAASFDLKYQAIKNNSLIELIVIIANQIDAYLRLSIMMAKQLKNKNNDIDQKYFYQGDSDKAIMERAIYKEALVMDIITNELFQKLESVYKKRNKIIHRYIISDLRTRDLKVIASDYEDICEEVRLKLAALEKLQFSEKIGIHATLDPARKKDQNHEKLVFSGVNDKHLIRKFKREI